MPWSHTSPMDQKTRFIADDLRDHLSVTERCELSGVSRQTGDTWIDRSLTHGPQGLEARSRRPSTSPRHTPDHVVAELLDARRRHPSWGAKKRLSLLRQRHPHWPWPARSTVCDIRRRHGLVPQKRWRHVIGHPGTPASHMGAPHAVWSADGKGHFKTGDGRYGFPLPLTDGSRRFLLACQARSSTRGQEAKPLLTRVFKACGLPQRLRTDHGVPLATQTLGRRSQLSAWGVRLGLLPEVIEPGTPHQNGRHERLPRTLNADTTRPPGANLRAQPPPFTHFRQACNQARPHEALDRRTPAACSAPSSRTMPTKRPPLESPDRFAGRDGRATGGLRWTHPWGNVSPVGVGAAVGLEDIDDGVCNVSFGPLQLGRLLERHRRIEDAYGRLTRHR
jgi:putative transposase